MGLNRLDDIRYLLEGSIFCKINQALMEWVNGPKIIYLFRTLSMYIYPFIQFTDGYQKLEFHLSCCELVNHQFLKT